MRAIATLLRWRLVVAARFLRERDLARLAVVTAFVVVCVAVMVAEYRFLSRSFQLIAGLGVAGPPLTLFTLEAFFVLVLVIAILSGVATGSTVFFRVAENRLLLSTPVSLRSLFLLRSVETAGLTSWACLLLAGPALLALGDSYNRSGGFYLVGASVLLAFLAFAASLGIVLTMVLAALLGHFRSRLAIIGLTVALLGVAGLLVARSVVPSRADFAVMFEPGMLNGTTIAMHFVEEKFARWPSHAFAASLFGLATAQGSDPGWVFVGSALWPLVALVAAYWGGGRLFRRLAWTASEGVLVARAEEAPGRAHRRGVFPRLLRGPVGALLEKEAVSLARSPEELGRAGFVAFLLVLYTVFFLRVPVPDRAGTEEVLARLVAFSLLAAGYFVTTLALRFAFPTVSLEGRAVWILLATPVRLRALFWAKLGFYSLVSFVGLGGITLVGGIRLGLSGIGLGLFATLLALMTVTITAVALGLGFCWPDFRGRTADELATSGGGLLTTGISLGYVALVGWAGYRLIFAHLTGATAGGVVVPLLAAFGLSVGIATGPLLAARRRVAAFEVSGA